MRGDDNEGKRDKFWGPSRPASLLINMIYASKKKKIVIAIEFFFLKNGVARFESSLLKIEEVGFFFLFVVFCEGKIIKFSGN